MIAHIDADSFFASVLQRKHPHLRGKPLLALGMGGGCVIAASYEAKAKGVKTGMPLKEAMKLCPDAVRAPSDFRETGLASQQIENILGDLCPVLEQMSIDEWFLDLKTLQGGVPADPLAWALATQARVRKLTGLSVSVGVAPTKLLAKMASEYRKPSGVTVVGMVRGSRPATPLAPHHDNQERDLHCHPEVRGAAAPSLEGPSLSHTPPPSPSLRPEPAAGAQTPSAPGSAVLPMVRGSRPGTPLAPHHDNQEHTTPQVCHPEVLAAAAVSLEGRLPHHGKEKEQVLDIETFLQDRPTAAIPGIGRRRQVHAQARNWETAWDIAQAPSDVLIALFGRPGDEMRRELLGETLHGVTSESGPPKSVSRCRSFHGLASEDLLWAHVLQHLSYVVLRMRRHDLACLGVSVWLRDRRYEHASAHAKLPQPLDTEQQIAPYVRKCFNTLREPGQSYTQAGLALWNLRPQGGLQFSLFEEPRRLVTDEALQSTLDRLRTRFGRDVICRGASLPVSKPHRPELGFAMVEN